METFIFTAFYAYNYFSIFVVCQQDFDSGVMWGKQGSNTLARVNCSELHPSFRPDVYITRWCLLDRVWGSVDISACTIRPDASQSFFIMTEVRGLSIADNATVIADYVSDCHDMT